MKIELGWVSLALMILVNASWATEVEMEDGVKLVFSYGNTEEVERELRLVAADEEELIWKSGKAERVVIGGRVTNDFYSSVELIQAKRLDKVITVLFQASPGKQVKVPAHLLAPDSPFSPRGQWTESDLLVRSFVKENDGWRLHLSFYPETFFGDLGGEVIREIAVIDRDSINVIFSGSWEILERNRLTIGGPYKYKFEDGLTEKRFRFLPDKNVLCVLNEGGNEIYIRGSVWWLGESIFATNDYNLNNMRSSIREEERGERVQAAGIKIENLQFIDPVPEEKRDSVRIQREGGD